MLATDSVQRQCTILSRLSSTTCSPSSHETVTVPSTLLPSILSGRCSAQSMRLSYLRSTNFRSSSSHRVERSCLLSQTRRILSLVSLDCLVVSISGACEVRGTAVDIRNGPSPEVQIWSTLLPCCGAHLHPRAALRNDPGDRLHGRHRVSILLTTLCV